MPLAETGHDHETGELCGSAFWAQFNRRFHQLFPEQERYVAEIEKSIAAVFAYVKSHKNVGSEKIRKDLKQDRPVVQDALGRLIDAKKVKMKGVKRAATYTMA